MMVDTDLADPCDVENLRRSVAMLDTAQRVFTKADADRVLEALHDALTASEAAA